MFANPRLVPQMLTVLDLDDSKRNTSSAVEVEHVAFRQDLAFGHECFKGLVGENESLFVLHEFFKLGQSRYGVVFFPNNSTIDERVGGQLFQCC